MRSRSLICLSLVVLISFAISSCAPKSVLGIDEPIVVRRVDFVFYEVESMEVFKIGSDIVTPSAPYDMLIAIRATTEYSETMYPCEWKGDDGVKLEFSKDGKTENADWGVCGSNDDKGWVRFFFATYADGYDYVIIFPDGQRVPLDGLIDINTGETL